MNIFVLLGDANTGGNEESLLFALSLLHVFFCSPNKCVTSNYLQIVRAKRNICCRRHLIMCKQ